MNSLRARDQQLHIGTMHQLLHTRAIRESVYQSGVLSRSQLLQLGFTDAYLRGFVRSRRFAKLAPGIYNTVTGEVTIDARRWAAHLLGGPSSYLFGASALQFWGKDVGEKGLRLAVPAGTRRVGVKSLALSINYIQTYAPREIKFVRSLPVEAPADALIDSTGDLIDPEAIQDLISECLQQRIVRTRDLEVAIRRKRMPHRAVFEDTLGLAKRGRTTRLEIMADRRVLGAHGLPQGVGQRRLHLNRNDPIVDVFYEEYGVILEFDGRLWHDTTARRNRDMRRDRLATVNDIVTLRFNWNDVRYGQCESAIEIATLLKRRGWQGEMKPCADQKCDVLASIR